MGLNLIGVIGVLSLLVFVSLVGIRWAPLMRTRPQWLPSVYDHPRFHSHRAGQATRSLQEELDLR